MDGEIVVIALIAAIGPTLAALGAWRATNRNTKSFQVSNGTTPGYMIEQIYEDIGRQQSRMDNHLEDHP